MNDFSTILVAISIPEWEKENQIKTFDQMLKRAMNTGSWKALAGPAGEGTTVGIFLTS